MTNFAPQKHYNFKAIREREGVQLRYKSKRNHFSGMCFQNCFIFSEKILITNIFLLYQRNSGWLLISTKHNCEMVLTAGFSNANKSFLHNIYAACFFFFFFHSVLFVKNNTGILGNVMMY